jgi:protein tyrosine/serine phosphatase
MQIRLSSLRQLLLLFSILTFSSLAIAQPSKELATSDIKIKNFGRMDDRFYRGAQPKERDYKTLAELGVKTIIDLRDDPKSYGKKAAEAVGIRYINIPMSDKKYPDKEDISKFLQVVNDSSTGRFFVHCAGGRHRTGVAGAVYRFNLYKWNYDQVYKEMKDYDFYTRWGHGSMKTFVQDYWKEIEGKTEQGTEKVVLKTE